MREATFVFLLIVGGFLLMTGGIWLLWHSGLPHWVAIGLSFGIPSGAAVATYYYLGRII